MNVNVDHHRYPSGLRLDLTADKGTEKALAGLANSYGFYQSKPATSFSPVAITLDEHGSNWRKNKIQLPRISDLVNSYLVTLLPASI